MIKATAAWSRLVNWLKALRPYATFTWKSYMSNLIQSSCGTGEVMSLECVLHMSNCVRLYRIALCGRRWFVATYVRWPSICSCGVVLRSQQLAFKYTDGCTVFESVPSEGCTCNVLHCLNEHSMKEAKETTKEGQWRRQGGKHFPRDFRNSSLLYVVQVCQHLLVL